MLNTKMKDKFQGTRALHVIYREPQDDYEVQVVSSWPHDSEEIASVYLTGRQMQALGFRVAQHEAGLA